MGKRQVVFWVDESILRAFDDWRMERRLPSRSAALVELMTSAAGPTEAQAEEMQRQAMVLVQEDAKKDHTMLTGLEGGDPVRAAHDRAAKKLEDRPAVLEELRGRIDEIQTQCPHPKAKRVVMAWGAKCGECNAIVR